MSTHPVFLLVLKKLKDAESAFQHMLRIHDNQVRLKGAHPDFYSEAVHGQALSADLQGLYTQWESILKRLLEQIDDYVPSSKEWHSELLQQAALQTDTRTPILSQDTFEALSQLRQFRQAVRANYASQLRFQDVMANFEVAKTAERCLAREFESFVQEYGAVPAPSAGKPPNPRG